MAALPMQSYCRMSIVFFLSFRIMRTWKGDESSLFRQRAVGVKLLMVSQHAFRGSEESNWTPTPNLLAACFSRVLTAAEDYLLLRWPSISWGFNELLEIAVIWVLQVHCCLDKLSTRLKNGETSSFNSLLPRTLGVCCRCQSGTRSRKDITQKLFNLFL
jgi:hypothetical protein